MARKSSEAMAARAKLEQADVEYRASILAKGRPMDSYGRVMTARPENDKPMRDFWDAVGEKPMLVALRESGNERAMQLAMRLTKAKRNLSLARLCREEGVSLQDLNDMWKKYNLAVGQARQAALLPDAMEDTAIDALSTYVVCNRCDGTGLITRPVKTADGNLEQVEATCPACKGAREVRQAGDKDSRALLFESMGVIKRGGGMTQAVQINMGDGGFEDMMNASQKLIQGQRIDDVED